MISPKTGIFGGGHIYVDSLDKYIPIINLSQKDIEIQKKTVNLSYIVKPGDILTIIVWGQEEAFPLEASYQINNPINARMVDNNGEIFFPYIGNISVAGKSIEEIRSNLTSKLSENFKDPQLDITVTKYNNNQSVYVLGEVSKPSIIQLGLEQVSLTNAIGQSRGLNSITSKSTDVFLVRSKDESEPKIYKVNLKNPSGFILANQFYVKPQDVIFVGASSITRWNRVISQLFPFTSFLNQIDQIDSRD